MELQLQENRNKSKEKDRKKENITSKKLLKEINECFGLDSMPLE